MRAWESGAGRDWGLNIWEWGWRADLRMSLDIWQESWWGLEARAEGLKFGTWGTEPGDWVFGVES